jgi:ABC-2 type transport system ATP-binding protein
LIRCVGIGKTYPNGKSALHDINLETGNGRIFVLIGRNGSGKTTLVRILSTELKPTAGSAYVDGIDVVAEPEKVREKIAIVPQEARTLNWTTPRQTVFSYLLWRGFTQKEARKRTKEALDMLGITEYADNLNRNLSGGMKRKVLVATVLASEAEIIFLDEPTTGLDPVSRREFWDILRRTSRDRFVFLTTHYLEEAEELANGIGILENGRLVRTGTLDELRRSIDYNFSVKIMKDGRSIPLDGMRAQKYEDDESVRVLLDEDDAYELSRKLAREGFRFTINPLSLEDIFFYLVKNGKVF